MKSNQDLVRDFHEAFGAHISDYPSIPPIEHLRLRVQLLMEETEEVRQATFELLPAEDAMFTRLERVAKECADVAYVLYGMAVAWGFDLDAVIREVHRSNMTKLGSDGKPILREDRKVLKGPNYKEPNVRRVLGLITSEEEPHETPA